MKIVGIAVLVDAILWVLVFFMYAFGVGHPSEAADILGSISGVLALIVFLMAMGSTTTKGPNDDGDR